jgi:hypothetical protein
VEDFVKKFLSSLKKAQALPKALRQAHWTEASSFPEWWAERGQLLLDVLHRSAFTDDVNSFSEYGCGPHSPFAKSLAATRKDAVCHALDLRKWDDQTVVADLNKAQAKDLPVSDCGVLAGVIEYLNSPVGVFEELAKAHKFLLFSYCFAPWTTVHRVEQKTQMLAQRATKGWRNHLSFDDLVVSTARFGYVCDIVQWRDQVLVLAARFDQN